MSDADIDSTRDELSKILAQIEEVRGYVLALRTDLTDSLREIAHDLSAKCILNLEKEAVRLETEAKQLETEAGRLETDQWEVFQETLDEELKNYQQRQERELFLDVLRVFCGCGGDSMSLRVLVFAITINSIDFVTFILQNYKFPDGCLEHHAFSCEMTPQIRAVIQAAIPIRRCSGGGFMGLVVYGPQNVKLTN